MIEYRFWPNNRNVPFFTILVNDNTFLAFLKAFHSRHLSCPCQIVDGYCVESRENEGQRGRRPVQPLGYLNFS